MRNFLLLLTLAVISAFYVNNAAAQYCAPPGTTLYTTGCTDDDYIRSFSTTGGSSNITNNNTGCNNLTTSGYTFFNTQTHAGVQGTVVNFSLSSQNTDIWNDGFKIWVDWNGDGTFNNTDELVYSPTALTAPGVTVTGTFTIPPTATPGNTRLRVRCVFNTTTFDACSSHTFGEVEDYNFQVVAAVACNGMPNPGTPNVTPSTVCLGDPVSLNATGVSLFSGLTYQWEVSTTNATTGFAPIAGATTISATTSQTFTSWYRLKVTCTSTNDIAYTTATQVTSPPVLAGIYTINKNVTNPTLLFPNTTTFKSFNDAYNAIKCGISDSVKFIVQPGSGPYNEQLIMSSINGATEQHFVKFEGSGETITFAGTTTERAVIKLKNGAKHIRLENLVINANTGTFGYGVQLLNNADSNIVRNCTINLSLTDITQGFAGIVINGTDAGPIATGTVLCDANQFLNNTINGGYYGVTMVATFSGGASGNNRFYGNTIQNFYATGMHIAGSYNTIIDSNFITRPTRNNVHTDFNGILFITEKNTNCQVTRNRIYNPFGGTPASTSNFFGINFNSSDASVGAENVVANNIIGRVNGNGPVHGISNTGSDYVYYLHNTISLDEATSTATGVTRGFSQQTAAAGLIFYNNLITVKRGGTGAKHAIYLGATLLQGQDYNNYFINAVGGTSNLGFYQSDRATLALWQTATTQEANSISTDPVFTDITNIQTGYIPVSSAMNDKGTYLGLPIADIDIFNTIRSQTTPDVGAVEYTPPPCTVPAVNGTASVTPSPICPNNPVQLKLAIGLFGSSQTFQWQSSATGAAGTFTTNVSSPMIVTDTIIMAPTTTTYYRLAATCGGSTTYSNIVQLVVNPAMPGGTYTINKGSATTYVAGVAGGNFISFNAAKAAMTSCGILGPVVFNGVVG